MTKSPDFSVSDISHTLHYLLKILNNMKRIDLAEDAEEGDGDGAGMRVTNVERSY